MNKKDEAEPVTFFVPPEGLDVRDYLNRPLPADANSKQVRIRKQAIHHIGRYNWAARVLKRSPHGRVLDIGCGGGYGSQILASALPGHHIVGADHDHRAIAFALETYGTSSNLAFEKIDVATWQNIDTRQQIGEFDYIVCFDTLEHMLHREIALIHMAENLSVDGSLLFSTPCGRRENLLNPGWEQRKIEYAYPFLYNLMKRFFADVKIPDDRSLPELSFWENVINKDENRYLLRANPMVCARPVRLGLDHFERIKMGSVV